MNAIDKSGLQTVKTYFKDIFRENIRRPGAAELSEWLESTDFFTAPAGAKYHGAHIGGLMVHSLNVYSRLLEITARDVIGEAIPALLTEDVVETVAILGLLHDVCKVGVYHQETKRRKNPESGKWEDYLGYTFRDPFPLGHGEKSLFLITRHMALTEEEALAIRWHMGAYDAAVKGGDRAMNEAMHLSPWVWRLQEADMCAAYIDEQEAAE
uniref:HD domain-containing protein n=1 Tax=Dulem virus 34 TaxID=3145752 RepID=A0AAU8B8Z9_9CAUD